MNGDTDTADHAVVDDLPLPATWRERPAFEALCGVIVDEEVVVQSPLSVGPDGRPLISNTGAFRRLINRCERCERVLWARQTLRDLGEPTRHQRTKRGWLDKLRGKSAAEGTAEF
ncbi:hypothetical protein D5S17_04765 [Pseudonocardiaceae bacterium YIM PH 21723]|nr:hypothetical protein D5S17_04765 [Pseudonocardiaceae bacterium YIM PH 21723]